jgi:hypothetical protein
VLLLVLVVLPSCCMVAPKAAQHSHGPVGTRVLLVQQAGLPVTAGAAAAHCTGPRVVLENQNNPVHLVLPAAPLTADRHGVARPPFVLLLQNNPV